MAGAKPLGQVRKPSMLSIPWRRKDESLQSGDVIEYWHGLYVGGDKQGYRKD
jgi:hypothetical protein